MYKVSLILLVLYLNGHGGKASLLKLHLFSWALKSKKNLEFLQEFAINEIKEKIKFFGIELNLNRALNLAVANKLINFANENYDLTEAGKSFAEYIVKTEDLFVTEKQILKIIGKNIPEKKIKELVKYWKNV
jgi:hypothetical protein